LANINLTSRFQIEAFQGSDALAEVLIGVEDEKGRVVSARARMRICNGSVEALVAALTANAKEVEFLFL